MTDISIHVNKLAHYVEEIRIRALNNIISKLGCGLLNEELLIDQDDLFPNLIKWFSFNEVPEKCKVLCLILRLVEDKNGVALLLRADPGLIKLKNIGGSDEKILIDKICEIVLPESDQGHQLPSHSEVNHSTPDCSVTATDSTAVNPKSDVLLQGDVITNNDCSIEKNHIINCNAAREKITKTVPIQSSSTGWCQTVPNISNFNGFKKINCSIRSTYAKNVNVPNRTNQIINGGNSNGDDYNTSAIKRQKNNCDKINNNKQKMKNFAIVESDESYDTSFCVWLLPWQKLVKPDGHVLTAVENSLKNSVMIEHTCQFFTTVMLHDYPPEVFLQRHPIIKNMLYLAGNGSRPAINALSEFVKLLYNRILFFLDPSTSCLKLEVNPLSPNSSDVSPPSEKEGSFPDNVALYQYKEERRKVSNQIVSDVVIAGVDQLAVPQFCAAALLSLVPFCGQIEEVAAPLFIWLIKLLDICIHDYYSLWSSVNIRISVIQQQLYNTMMKFAEAISKSMSMEPINRILLINSVNQFIKSLVPLSIASSCIPLELQNVLIELLIDPAIILLYNNLHKNLLVYVQSFKEGGESDYNVIKVYYKSMKSSLKFLHEYKTLTTEETVKLFKSALPSLVLHHRLEMIKFFIDNCNEKFVDKNTEEATMILVTLLAHVDSRVCLETYSACHEKISTFLGPEQATKGYDPFPKLKFFINAFVLREIICHGLSSDDKQVQNYSQEMMVLLLKCQMLVSEQSWLYIWSEITPVLPLLQSFAEKETPLGDTVIEMFNPDVAKTVGMGELQVLLGNIRFMMSNNEYCRVEAVARVMWLINITIKDAAISNICFIDKCITKKQKLCGIYEAGSMIRVVEVLKCQTIDEKILQSVLAQLSVMSDDPHLHGVFMDEDGLKIVINLLQSFSAKQCDERKMVLPVITTLKNLARHSSKIRLQLCEDLIALKCIVKCLFMYHNRWRLQRDSAQLLALIVFAEFFVTTPDSVSLPHIIVSHFRLPFESTTHWNVSPNSQPTLKGTVIHKKKNLNILSILWLALESNNILNIDKPPTHINPDMNVKLQDLRQLQGSAVGHNCKKLLNIMQTAKSHKDVHIILPKLTKFLEVCNYQEEIKDEIQDSHLWKHTFMKFLSAYPLSAKDEKLLHAILQFLRYVIVILRPQMKWLSDLLTNPFKPMLKLLTSYSDTNREKGLILWKELLMSLLELCGDCCKLGNSAEVCWNGLTIEIMRCLHHTQTQHFYNLAFLGTILNCLSCILTAREGVTEELRCDILWELLAAFHYGTPNSCMGLRITRQTLLILNNLLHLDLKNKKSNKWDENWLKENNIAILSPLCHSRDIIIRAATLQLISGICTEKHSATILLEYIPSLWNTALSIISDHDEASIVREQAAVVCTNIICHNKQEIFLSTILENSLFSQLKRILDRLVFEKIVWNKNRFILPEDNDSEVLPTTPNFIKAISSFITTLLAVYPVEVAEEIKKKNLIISFIRCMLKMNVIKKHISLEVCNMYSSVCTLLHSCISIINPTNIPPDLIIILVKLLNHNNYGTDKSSLLIRDKLWGNVLILLSVISHDLENCDNIVFPDFAVETICYCLDENTNPHLQQQAMMSVAVICSFFNIENSKQVCEKLILLWDKSILTKRKKPLIEALTSLLGRSKEASETALRMGLLQLLIYRLRNVLVTIAIETGDTSRLRKGNPLLAELSLYLGLSCNFLFGCPDVKVSAANAGFADTLHKLWVWCLADIQIFLIALQTLITFTADNPLGARSMLLTSTTAGVGQRKTQSSFSLVHAVINLITTNKEHYPVHVINRAFLLLTHSCQTPEARAIIAKSNLINKFDFRHHKKVPSDDVEGVWLKFLTVFSYYPEGQLAIPKNKETVELLTDLSASNKSSISYAAICVLRNISFHPSNRPRLLTSENFLSHLGNKLNTSDSLEEKKAIVAIIWAMVANNQKAKLSVRSAGLDIRLQLAAAMIPFDNDNVELFDYVVSLIVPNIDHKVTAT